MSTLLMRLAAPLQSWGVGAKYDNRGTERAPTKSGVIGLVAAALGRRRDEGIADLNALRFGVRVDRSGALMYDYHTAKSAKSAYVTRRYYLEDAAFLAGLEGDAQLLDEIERALRAPMFPLFLGRRSCPPEGRLSLGIRNLDLLDALKREPPVALRQRASDAGQHILIDSESGDGAYFMTDAPLSFDQRRREYGYRSVRDLHIPPVQTGGEPSTRHDPMHELEG